LITPTLRAPSLFWNLSKPSLFIQKSCPFWVIPQKQRSRRNFTCLSIACFYSYKYTILMHHISTLTGLVTILRRLDILSIC
jgi:hypothetical protein